jgi:hypothetical protein
MTWAVKDRVKHVYLQCLQLCYRLALTDADPALLEIALTKANPELLKVALTKGVNPANLRVALTEVSDNPAT